MLTHLVRRAGDSVREQALVHLARASGSRQASGRQQAPGSRRASILVVAAVLGVGLASTPCGAESAWPHWRGPIGNGVSPDGRPPVSWGESKNLRWKTAIPGKGSASPVVVGQRVFVSTAVPVEAAAPTGAGPGGTASADAAPGSRPTGGQSAGPSDGPAAGPSARPSADASTGPSASPSPDPSPGEPRGEGRSRGGRGGGGRGQVLQPQRFTLLALDRANGKILWSKVAVEATPAEGHHATHGFASASPFSDGERVYAYFGSRGLFAYDLEGKELWKKTDFGTMRTRNGFGEGSSPAIHGNTIVVPWDHEGPSYVIALDAKTGRPLWKTDRDEPSCWATPLVVEHAGKAQVVLSGERFVRSYDLASGTELWRSSGQTSRPLASPVAGHGLVFVGSGFQGSFLGAFRLDRSGDLGGTDGVVWSIDSDTPDVPSPLLSGNRLYFFAARRGEISCVDALTKKTHYWKAKLDGLRDIYASPVAANGKVYLTSREGTTVVIEDSEEFKVVATNRLDEGVDATPAIAGREIFIRGQNHLYAFAEP